MTAVMTITVNTGLASVPTGTLADTLFKVTVFIHCDNETWRLGVHHAVVRPLRRDCLGRDGPAGKIRSAGLLKPGEGELF